MTIFYRSYYFISQRDKKILLIEESTRRIKKLKRIKKLFNNQMRVLRNRIIIQQ